MENIQISYPGYFLIFIALAAIAYALGLYFRDKRMKENKTWLPRFLGLIRFLSIFGLLLLLLAPLFKNFIQEKQNPVVVIVRDQSRSIKETTEASQLEAITDKIASLQTELGEDFDVINMDFAENLSFNENDSISERSTNISDALEYVSESFEDQNLGAVVLITDGIYNEGKNPIYADLQFAAPLHALALGDTTIRTDLLIKNVLHNRIVYLNDRFLIEADIQAYNAIGSQSTLKLFSNVNGKRTLVKSENVSINSNNFFQSFQFELSATEVGNVKYELQLGRLNNEDNLVNNNRNIYIEILDARQKVLLLAANSHPDIKAIKGIVNSNKNYELDVYKSGESPGNLKDYDLVIFHNLPNSERDFNTEIESAIKLKKASLFIVGADTNIKSFNTSQTVLQVIGNNTSLNDVTALIDPSFNLFTLEDNLKNDLEKFVPLKAPFGEYVLDDNTNVLLNQKIGTVETKYPLLAYNEVNNHKQAVLLGEGVWRWRLFEFLEFEHHDYTRSLFMKTLQYISLKEDKRPFRAYANKKTYKENENILFDAQLYNANYESINDPEAFLTVSNSDGEKFNYTFSKSSNYYVLEAGRFPEGNYTFNATTNFNGVNMNAGGRFSVQSIIKEQYDLTAKHDMLNLLTQKFGGTVIYPSELDSINHLITQNSGIKPIVYQKADTEPLLNFKWYLLAILLLLGLEWFLRRYFGNY